MHKKSATARPVSRWRVVNITRSLFFQLRLRAKLRYHAPRSPANKRYVDSTRTPKRNMQTSFTLAQLADPGIKEADKILRACVHCGFCTATCPTYVLLGDERDSPRGRIYMIKDMLEKGRP